MLNTFTKEQLEWLAKNIENISNLKTGYSVIKKLLEFETSIKNCLEQTSKQININLCFIGGYELLREGTQTFECKDFHTFFYHFFSYCEYSENIEVFDNLANLVNYNLIKPLDLFKLLEKIWIDRFNNGGGSGWVQINDLNSFEVINEDFLTSFKTEIENYK